MQADEIRRLKRELGHRLHAGRVGALMAHLGVQRMQAELLLRLYAGGGRAVPHEMLADVLSEDAGPEVVKVHVSRIRDAFQDPGAVKNAYGVGYSLSIPAVSRVMAILEPPELQDARS